MMDLMRDNLRMPRTEVVDLVDEARDALAQLHAAAQQTAGPERLFAIGALRTLRTYVLELVLDLEKPGDGN